jgi:hypothetical protein
MPALHGRFSRHGPDEREYPLRSEYLEIMEWLWIVGGVVGYVILMRWILPRFGVAT